MNPSGNPFGGVNEPMIVEREKQLLRRRTEAERTQQPEQRSQTTDVGIKRTHLILLYPQREKHYEMLPTLFSLRD